MAYLLCRHIRANGRRCQAPALREESWCYFHARLHARHRDIRPVGTVPAPGAIDLPAIEDHDSVQLAISIVLGALAGGKLDEKRARAIFHGLTIASRNLQELRPLPSSDYRISSYMPTLDGFAMASAATSDGSPVPPRDGPRALKSIAHPE